MPLAAASQPVVIPPTSGDPWAQTVPLERTVPLGDGRYLTGRAVLDDYLVCAAEARVLRLQLRDVDRAADIALEALAERAAETGALRDALAAADVELLACDGRRRADAANADELRARVDAEANRADAAEQSRDRWRTAAIAAPPLTLAFLAAVALAL